MMFEKIKRDILGKKYSLSIAFVSERKSRQLNKKYRNTDKPTNVLSFALSKESGELILCKSVIRKELRKFSRSFPKLLGYLVIHGMLHLKGLRHSSTMEKLEEKYDQKYFRGDRHGLREYASGSRRIHQGRKKSEDHRRR